MSMSAWNLMCEVNLKVSVIVVKNNFDSFSLD